MTLTSQLIKGIFGPLSMFSIDLVALFLLLTILFTTKIHVNFWILILSLYVVLHGAWQFFTYQGLLENDYTFYRNFVRGFLFYLLLTNCEFKSYDQIILFFRSIIFFVSIIILVDVYSEWVFNKLLNVNLSFLPWVFLDPNNRQVYGTGMDSRIPTLLGAPHFLGLIQASVLFLIPVLWNGKNMRKLLFFAVFISLFLINSRMQILVVVVGLAIATRKYQTNSLFNKGFLMMFWGVASLVIVYALRDAYVLTTNVVYAAQFSENNIWVVILNNIIMPGDFLSLFFGRGGVTGFEQYVGLLSFAGIEAGILEEMIPKYGLIFVFLYYITLVSFCLKISKKSFWLVLAMLPFLMSPLHFWLVNSTFVCDYFFFVLALIANINKQSISPKIEANKEIG